MILLYIFILTLSFVSSFHSPESVCVCVCVCVREKEREGQTEREREKYEEDEGRRRRETLNALQAGGDTHLRTWMLGLC